MAVPRQSLPASAEWHVGRTPPEPSGAGHLCRPGGEDRTVRAVGM